jgi:hypothetical protein
VDHLFLLSRFVLTVSEIYFWKNVIIRILKIFQAAHCLDGFSNFVVNLGTISSSVPSLGPGVFQTSEKTVHENYNPYIMLNDIGLLLLSTAVQFSR